MFIRDRLAHKRPVFSFEFFPPRTTEGETALLRSLERLAPLEPDFVSVTYGAGGSTRTRTIDLVVRIKREFGIEAMAHLTCAGATRDELAGVLDQLAEAGVKNLLALRGDPPKGEQRFVATQGGFAQAAELVAFARAHGEFSIGAACYPETHPEARDAEVDLAHLKAKVDAGVDFLVTQLFFDNDAFFDFERRARAIGITQPMLAGIMPVTNVSQIDRFSQMCGASIPARLRERLGDVEGDAQEVFWTGVSYAAHQCRGLLRPAGGEAFERAPQGVAGIHFYTLNKSPAARAIFEILRLARVGF
ncbi:MAG: methylenetetrahydrofolate reductase [NAD(P)H] [Nannocystaceae bacterium]|nr:methylenetetrahydrofolate reductase [NAD(P)H] [Deltaproteobacteria bacterium]MBP7285389.1 methylenetetrahydrofolate reductase [NAD(P)H] [Nannocystaceae bacterium]